MIFEFEIDDREFVKTITAEFDAFQEIYLDDAAERTQKVWEEDVMGTWDRPYKVETEKTAADKRRIYVSNTEVTANNSDDPRLPRANVPFYLNEGFSPRFALLSDDWQSKTHPGQIRSGSGAGVVLKTGKEAGAQNAVAGRDFEGMVAKKMEGQLETIANDNWLKVWR